MTDWSTTMNRALLVLLLIVLLVAIPAFLIWREAARTGIPLSDYLSGLAGTKQENEKPVGAPPAATIERQTIGDPPGDSPPWITHVRIIDLDGDGRLDVVLCDAKENRVTWIRQDPEGVFEERPIGDSIEAPAHVSAADIDGDGDLDLLVAKMGAILPNNDKIGAVVILDNRGGGNFVNRVLVDNVARVTDVEPGDFDGDGDLDLAVAQFGYDDGEIRWMENHGGWRFESHQLLDLSGTIHAPVGDMDGDGDLDIVAVVSQEWEEIYVFDNDGHGDFDTRLIYGATNEDFGSSGISLADLDLDGDLDVIYTNGDAFDYIPPGPRPWHGVQWLENEGGMQFTYHRIGTFPGAYFANAVDPDHDGDLDLVLVSAFNEWEDPSAPSFAWFENDGALSFVLHPLATEPTHLLALDSADIDGDGNIDFVTGGMYTYPPYDRVGRVSLWTNGWPAQ